MENNKKLQRDTQHKVIGGVCSGLANFIFSTGFWVYIILWIVMPAGIDAPSEANYFVSPDGSTEASPDSESGGLKTSNSKGTLTAGLILIGIGVLGLLNRYIPEINWQTAWPIMLIVLGLFLIFPFSVKKS